jgi:hypothetical protein
VGVVFGGPLPACSADATEQRTLHAGETLVLESEHGLVTGRVGAEHLEAGRNVFSIVLEPATAELVEVSAFMPAHGHGAPQGRIVTVAVGEFRVEDVVLSMSGLWEVTADVRVGESVDQLEFSVDVP